MVGPPEWQQVVVDAIPGSIGSAVALRWISGTWQQRAGALFGGAACAYYGAPALSSIVGASTGLTGFLIGLFGMQMAAKVFEAIEDLETGPVLSKILRKFGLK